MRGTDHQQSSMFSYISAEQRVPKDHPLRAIRAKMWIYAWSSGEKYKTEHGQHFLPSNLGARSFQHEPHLNSRR